MATSNNELLTEAKLQEYSKTYNAIISFYDLAEKLIDSVEHPEIKDPVAQLEYIEPIVKQIEEATDILAEEYRNFVKSGKKPGFLAKKKIEKAIREVNQSIIECKNNLDKK